MVFPDISTPENRALRSPNHFYYAPVADRFLAFVIDTLLLGPVVGLLVAGQLKDVRSYLLNGEDSPETFIVRLLFYCAIVGLSILMQALFTFFWAATPGQRLLNLRVISVAFDAQDKRFHPLSFPQAILRSLLWWISGFLVGWPFLESLSHPQRRCLHDRGSDTMVVTLTPNTDMGPSAVEQKFVGSWMRLIVVGLIFMGGLSYTRVYQLTRGGYFSRDELDSKGYLCDVDLPENATNAYRLDILMSKLIISSSKDEPCLETESDLTLWNRESENKSIAYLAKLFTAKDKEQVEEYKAYICETYPEDESCDVANFFLTKDEKWAVGLRKKGLQLRVSRALLMQDELEKKNYISAAALLQDLMKEAALSPYLQKTYVGLAWQVNDTKKKGRAPASLELSQIVSDFKKRYGIP